MAPYGAIRIRAAAIAIANASMSAVMLARGLSSAQSPVPAAIPMAFASQQFPVAESGVFLYAPF